MIKPTAINTHIAKQTNLTEVIKIRTYLIAVTNRHTDYQNTEIKRMFYLNPDKQENPFTVESTLIFDSYI